MDEVAELIRTAEVPIIESGQNHRCCLGGKVERASAGSHFVSSVKYNDGTEVNAVFTHQDHVVDELEVIGSAEHCSICCMSTPNKTDTNRTISP